jgi:hypothetical protein
MFQQSFFGELKTDPAGKTSGCGLGDGKSRPLPTAMFHVTT